MNEPNQGVPKRWIATPALFWLVILNLILLLGPYVAPDEGTTILLIGRLPLAAMAGVWVVMGDGTIVSRVRAIGVAVGVIVGLDTLSAIGEFWMFVAFYSAPIVGGAIVGMIGNFLRRRESDPIGQPPQFSIAEIAGWTAFIAAVLGAMVLFREVELAFDSTFMLMTLGLHGAFVGVICLPCYMASGKSRGRWIGGVILSAVLFLFLEGVVYIAYDGTIPGVRHMVQEMIFYVVLTKIPAIIITLAVIIPLGCFPLWREVDVFESSESPTER